MKKVVIATIVCITSIFAAGKLSAQPKENVLRYIEKYRNLAMSEQQRVGIPAAIKLAQGIHETAAGNSELALNANNHFGIKCKSDWKGETYAYTDDRPNECFRKYNMDFESYQDHSNYLKNSPQHCLNLCFHFSFCCHWMHKTHHISPHLPVWSTSRLSFPTT